MGVDRTESRIRQMFAAISARYDLLNHLLSGGIDILWRKKTARLLGAPRARMLDVCTGTADLAIEFLRTHGGTFHVVGADFCRPMLEIGQRKLRHVAAAWQYLLVEADAQRLPFPDDSFDLVTVAFGLRNVTRHDQGLREMIRVTRPGGLIGVLDFSLPRVPIVRSLYLFYFRRILPLIGQTIARNREGAYEYLPASVLEFFEPEEMLQLFAQHGLVNCRAISFTLGIATLYVGQKAAPAEIAPGKRPADLVSVGGVGG